MKLENIDVNKTLNEAKLLLEKEKNISPALKAMFEMLFLIITLLANQFGLNSKNSSKPPASDKNRKRGSNKKPSGKKPGGQLGRIGKTLQRVDHPDEIEHLTIDKRTLPKGTYREAGYEARQVVDLRITRIIIEYRAQVLEDQNGRRFVAAFPAFVTQAIQYGPGFKSHSVYMSQFQLLPYNRIEDYFHDQANVSLSAGSIFNFNQEAFDRLQLFEEAAKRYCLQATQLNADETGIQVDKKRIWLHSLSNDKWTYFYPHEKRGTDAMDAMGVLPYFKGTLSHDHWKPYYHYACVHALCNAHHIRELDRAFEQDKQRWAEKMKGLLLDINKSVNASGGALKKVAADACREKYKQLLIEAEKECPPPEENRKKGQRGRIKKSIARNLLERFIHFENDILRFMEDPLVPFTNNQSENDLRMTKVQQKISGCFRSMEGAYIFCRVRGYISTCRKHGMSATDALDLLFQGKLPDFILSA